MIVCVLTGPYCTNQPINVLKGMIDSYSILLTEEIRKTFFPKNISKFFKSILIPLFFLFTLLPMLLLETFFSLRYLIMA